VGVAEKRLEKNVEGRGEGGGLRERMLFLWTRHAKATRILPRRCRARLASRDGSPRRLNWCKKQNGTSGEERVKKSSGR